MAPGTSVLIATADDDARGQLGRIFTRTGYATSEVSKGEEAFRLARKRPPSLIVLDLQLEDMYGYEACHELRKALGNDVPIILMSGERTEPIDTVAGLMIGADDYVAKPFDPDELLARARRLLSHASSASGALDGTLTGREVQVLQLLSMGSTQAQIAGKLFISAKTVGTHIQRILTKLDVHSRTEAVALAYRLGLVGGDGHQGR